MGGKQPNKQGLMSERGLWPLAQPLPLWLLVLPLSSPPVLLPPRPEASDCLVTAVLLPEPGLDWLPIFPSRTPPCPSRLNLRVSLTGTLALLLTPTMSPPSVLGPQVPL